MLRSRILAFAATLLVAGTTFADGERYDTMVWADVEIDANGRAVAIEFPGKVAGTALAENLRQQIASWEFEPAKHNGVPVSAKTSLEVVLDIDARGAQATVKVKNAAPSPRPIKQTPPRYPDAALRAQSQGAVPIEFLVNADGTVSDVRANAPGVDKRLVKATVDTVSTWTFRPEVVDGIPASTRVKTTIAYWSGPANRRPKNLPGSEPSSPGDLGSDALVADSHVKLKTDPAAAM
jgi:TonB family protein